MQKFITNNNTETQNTGQYFASEILTKKPGKQAVILALKGDLGAGKTTFLQGFAKGLGITEVINSPTFIIMKKFKIPTKTILKKRRSSVLRYEFFYHFDLYRLENQKDLEFLHFKEIISDPKNIVAVEWPEKIAGILPKNTISINFNHLEEGKRELTVSK